MTTASLTQPVSTYFADLDDPRVDRTKRHPLLSIVAVALCAVLCGADSWVEGAEFGEAQEGWFGQWLSLPHGIPSHDTFGRVFAALDPVQLERCFAAWVQDIGQATAGQVVAIDGKVLRGSHDRASGRGALDLVSAWAGANRLVLGQVAVAAGSNEIPAVPALLELLVLRGCIVTVDAMGCQTAIAQAIQAKGADYVLALKGNQETLHEAVVAAGADLASYAHQTHREVTKDHGRVETRTTTLITDAALLAYLDPQRNWTGLGGVVQVIAERRLDGGHSRETRYYLTSLTNSARLAHAAVRGHWGIENSVHWVLDMAFREDLSRVRTAAAAQNFSLLRRLALNLLRQDRTARCGIKARRFKAALSTDYLTKALTGSF